MDQCDQNVRIDSEPVLFWRDAVRDRRPLRGLAMLLVLVLIASDITRLGRSGP